MQHLFSCQKHLTILNYTLLVYGVLQIVKPEYPETEITFVIFVIAILQSVLSVFHGLPLSVLIAEHPLAVPQTSGVLGPRCSKSVTMVNFP